MRILFYNHAPEMSGAERMLLSAMAHARGSGHQVILCAPKGELSDSAIREGISTIRIDALQVGHTRSPLVLGRYLGRASRIAGQLRRATCQSRADIVYANSVRAGLVAAMGSFAIRNRPRLVVHLHDNLGQTLVDRLSAQLIAARADVLIAISGYVARSIPRSKAMIRVIYNGIDKRQYRFDPSQREALRTALALSGDDKVLAVVGQITPWKGQMEAIEALAQIRKAIPDSHLLIAGAPKFVGKHRRYDTPAYYRALKERAEKIDVVGHVHFLGDIEDVSALYSAADLVLVPSWAEPFGRVVVEAMAAGRAVLATRAGGVPEIITHGIDGWLVPPRDVSALAVAAIHLLASPLECELIAANGYRTAGENFSLTSFENWLDAIWRCA